MPARSSLAPEHQAQAVEAVDMRVVEALAHLRHQRQAQAAVACVLRPACPARAGWPGSAAGRRAGRGPRSAAPAASARRSSSMCTGESWSPRWPCTRVLVNSSSTISVSRRASPGATPWRSQKSSTKAMAGASWSLRAWKMRCSLSVIVALRLSCAHVTGDPHDTLPRLAPLRYAWLALALAVACRRRPRSARSRPARARCRWNARASCCRPRSGMQLEVGRHAEDRRRRRGGHHHARQLPAVGRAEQHPVAGALRVRRRRPARAASTRSCSAARWPWCRGASPSSRRRR